MKETEILLVRHPETEANVDGRFIGRGHADYTPEGLRQLDRVPRKVARFGPSVVWTSPLERARRLAERCARRSAARLNFDDRLQELDFGEAEGLTYEEIVQAGMVFNYRNLEQPVAPGGESRGQIERRTKSFCDELAIAGGRHAVITHGGVFRASLVILLDLASTDIWAFHIHNAQMAYIRVIEGHGTLEEYVRG